MSVTITQLIAPNSDTGGSTMTHTTASVSPTAGSIILLTIWHNANESPGTPTSSGLTLSTGWTQLGSTQWNSSWTVGESLWYCVVTSGSGTISWTTGSSAQDSWTVDQVTGFDSGSTFGTPVGNQGVNSLTLAALRDANSVGYGSWVGISLGTTIAGGTGFSVVDQYYWAAQNASITTEYKVNTTAIATTTAGGHLCGIAVEIKAAAGGGSNATTGGPPGLFTGAPQMAGPASLVAQAWRAMGSTQPYPLSIQSNPPGILLDLSTEPDFNRSARAPNGLPTGPWGFVAHAWRAMGSTQPPIPIPWYQVYAVRPTATFISARRPLGRPDTPWGFVAETQRALGPTQTGAGGAVIDASGAYRRDLPSFPVRGIR